jgi:ribose transport system substrate-binding protein
MGSPPWAAPLSFKLAMKIHNGETVAKVTEVPMPLVTSEDTKLCQTADLAELKSVDWSCNAVPFDVAPASYFIDVWSKDVPELDLYSALNGTVPASE